MSTLHNLRSQRLQPLAGEIAAIQMEQIKKVIHDRVSRILAPTLQRLERRAPLRIEGDDFAVED